MRGRLGHQTAAGAAQRGYSMVEMIVVCVLLTTLAAVSFPLATYAVKRTKEAELRSALRQMRNAIDEYKRYHDVGLIVGTDVDAAEAGYPEELEDLVEGVDLANAELVPKKFLRRVPIDPMIGEADWGKRSVGDDWDSTSWGGGNVYDVYSLSEGTGLNGIPYSEW